MEMRSKRGLALAVTLLAPGLLSGCVAIDWINYQGDFVVHVGSADPATQAVDRFQTLQLAIRAVMIKPAGEIRDQWHVTHSEPIILDLVQRARENTDVKVFDDKRQVRAIERVTVLVSVEDAVALDGSRLPICTKNAEGQTAERPCLAIAPGGSYVFDRKEEPVDMKRAKTTSVHFPLAVMCADMSKRGTPCSADTQPSDTEFFIQSRSSEGHVTHA